MSFFPGKTIGILGGGQLGRMTALAAAPLGITVHIFDPDVDCPAAAVSTHHVIADYTDEHALNNFAATVDAVTYEFENIPEATIRHLADRVPVFPDADALAIAQHRIREKEFLNTAGLETARFTRGATADDIHKTLEEWGVTSCIIKTTRMGYDGKGQRMIQSPDDVDDAVAAMCGQEFIIESLIDYICEISVIICRDQHGRCDAYTPGMNEHRNHILYQTTVPAPIGPALLHQAREMGMRLAERMTYIGVMGLELFVTKDGRLLANEIAPRPHNSGHWTIDACAHSQFEQQARITAGLPLAPCTRHHDAVMTNVLGREMEEVTDAPGRCIHNYGKTEPREGRKMGHMTELKEKTG